MKSPLYTVGLVAVIVAVVSGLTYMLHYGISPTQTAAPPDPISPGHARLTFITESLEREPGEGGDFELNTKGHHQFTFQNATTAPIRVGLHDKNCTCASVEICLLTPAESQRFHTLSAATHVLLGATWLPLPGGFPAGFLSHLWDGEAMSHFAKSEPRWQLLDRGGAPVTVAAGQWGQVRLNFKSDKPERIRLHADLWLQAGESQTGPRSAQRLQAVVGFTRPVMIYPEVVNLPEVRLGGTAQGEFVCWSATRSHFKLEPKVEDRHPCFEVSFRPLTQADRLRYRELEVNMLSGYIGTITVHERRSDKEQLDLGPIRRRLELVSDPDVGSLSVMLAGEVKGEVMLAGAADKTRLALGAFPSHAGVKKQFFLVSERPGVELLNEVQLEPPERGTIQVKLEKDASGSTPERTQWSLWVQVPPGRVAGALPRDTAVVLTIKGDPPRRIRIPVSGVAFN